MARHFLGGGSALVCRRVFGTRCSGWNIDYLALSRVHRGEYLLLFWGGGKRVWVWWCLTRCWVLRVRAFA